METQAYSFRYLAVPEKEAELQEIFELLCECDHDFVPPLSSRKNPTQKQFSLEQSDEKPYAYFEEMRHQLFVVAQDEAGKIVAFLTFKHGYTCPELSEFVPANYMSTACVSHAHRGRGLVSRLYTMVESELPEDMRAAYTTTRTWSTNLTQLHAFGKRGYQIICVKKDDRGPGVDTIYYARENVPAPDAERA